jgi:flagellar basal-body rod modification protein FlgD
MATTTAGINQAMTAAQTLTAKAATPTANATTSSSGTNGTSGSNDSSGGSATISANDFLTLLVTEMQNQDPTATQDPNEYINQLVEVNSLQQLIGINQTLTTAFGSTTTSSGSNGTGQMAGTEASNSVMNPATNGQATGKTRTSPAVLKSASNSTALLATRTEPNAQTQGNLSEPGVNPSALRVAHALDGRMRGVSAANGFSAIH